MLTRELIERDALATIERKVARDRLFGPSTSFDRTSYTDGAAWYVVRTNIKCEERARKGIEAKGFDLYVPMMTKRIRHARKVEDVQRPLFVRHMFVRIDANRQGFAPVRWCHGVESILGVCGVPSRVLDAEVDRLRDAEGVGAFDYRKGRGVGPKVGDLVTIDDEGPFRGWVAEVAEEADDRRRVGLLLKLFNSDRIVQFALDDLRTAAANDGR